MKWIRRVFLLLAVLACVLAGAVLWTALDSKKPVGFQITQAVDEGGQAFPIGVWYPTEARPWPTSWLGLRLMKVARDAEVAGSGLPLVVISHGNGGGPGSHADLALALAGAGYIVAAPMHAGDNFTDQSAAGTVPWLGARSRQLRASVDHMLGRWEGRTGIDAGRVGAFGFSAGGATVLVALGARPDLGQIAAHCARTPEFICKLLREGRSPLLNPAQARAGNVLSPDARIKAAVVAAPGLGFLMQPDALAEVRAPVQLWSGERDTHVPYASNTRMVREGLGQRAEFHSVPGAGHFSFLVPCGLFGPPLLCADSADFDRDAFHESMNASVIAFFGKHLGSLAQAPR
ncbi:dienelactone hydrolase [Massilia sp. IC2-476]|uniref:alpha/beta hydrolase family protein n=1 Tax=Massilia sp. IC2-476 TaxID=2887199 RepID=UPI001D130629|nr:dienelactone hydrolase [Massilia sp. IC2-476]MCC2974428.1 dienelactone hydrolase [Massilia sp. IC2-476]